MPKQIIIAEQHRTAAVFSEDQIEEIVVATGTHQVGDIYMGVVENILTSIDAAFVNIGDGERNGFIHVSDLGPLKLRRSAGSISDLLAPQQRVLVQVMKEPTGNKGPRLTGNISLPGRYVVLIPFGRGVNLSRRIRSEAERNRLRALAILVKPSGMGVLVRTEAEGMSEESIIEDLENLQRQWESVQQESSTTRYPSLLDRDRDFVQRVLRDLYTSEVNRIVVDTSDGMKRVKHHLLNWGDGKIPPGVSIDLHRERTSILEYFRVNAAIREALRPRVDLPSGGYIIIEPTEALTVIDVNSGSFTRSRTSRETVLWTNCEAAAEVARQMRLRNIAGVIVVDFIDMDSRQDQLQLLEHFNKALKADKSRPQIAQLTELGLVELTRKRQGQSIYELFGCPCTTCNGLGILAQLPGESAPQVAETAPRQWESRFAPTLEVEADEREFSLSGGIEPNLINHPSYQDRGGASRRRRRGTLALRERDPREGDRSSSSSERSLDRTSERPNGAVVPSVEVRSRRESREVVPRLAVVASSARSPVIPEPLPEPVAELPPERSKREIPRPKLEAPEIVHIEMTDEEQEVYAHLGISPLVFVNREVKDPRNAVISVYLPGEAPHIEPADTPAVTGVDSQEEPKLAFDLRDDDDDDDDDNNDDNYDDDGDFESVQEVVETAPVFIDAVEERKERREDPPIQSPAASRRRRRAVITEL